MNNGARKAAEEPSKAAHLITIFMCGDVMTGRGIDQVLPHPSAPVIYEPYLESARGYVEIAEEANGPIPQPVHFSYIWGDALAEWRRVGPDLRIINLGIISKFVDGWRRFKEKAYDVRQPEKAPFCKYSRHGFQ